LGARLLRVESDAQGRGIDGVARELRKCATGGCHQRWCCTFGIIGIDFGIHWIRKGDGNVHFVRRFGTTQLIDPQRKGDFGRGIGGEVRERCWVPLVVSFFGTVVHYVRGGNCARAVDQTNVEGIGQIIGKKEIFAVDSGEQCNNGEEEVGKHWR